LIFIISRKMFNECKKLIIHTDGGARGNPGPAAIGAVIEDEKGDLVAEISEYIGVATNNQAEYRAVIAAIEKAKELGAEELEFVLDSELVVKQLNREYRVKDKDLAQLFIKIYNAVMGFKSVSFRHVRREMNKEADKLVNRALDKNAKG
jgi:ribonuclease HI